MAGLIDEQAPAASVPGQTPPIPNKGPAPADQGSLDPESVSSKIKMPPELQNAYDRVVVAGMKVMFDPQTHELAMKQLQGEGPIAQRLGSAIAGLLVLLFKQSNQTMPPQVIIPAGTDLLVRAADFLRKSGTEQMTDQDVGEALSVMVETVLQKFGLDPAKVLNSFDSSQAPAGLVDGGAPPEPETPAETASPLEEQE